MWFAKKSYSFLRLLSQTSSYIMKWNKNIEVVLHLALWLLLFAALFGLLSQVFSIGNTIAQSLITILLLAGAAYFNAFIIVPHLFKKEKFGWYFLTIIGLIIGTTLLNILLTKVFFPDDAFGIFPFNDVSTLPGRIGIRKWRVAPVFLLNLITLFISTIYAFTKEFIKKEQRTAFLEQEKIAHELNFLRSQINPHFLFNALNNLHATVQLNPQKAGDYILKLGEMLRYVLEECKKDKVSLADEIRYIENYIFFQKQKDEGLNNVQFEVSGDRPETFFVEPMLFIALVENAFQHSYTDRIEQQHISIRLNIKEGVLTFTVRNNLGDKSQKLQVVHLYKFPDKIKKESFGLGLQNIKRRLELLYPNNHIFTNGIQGREYYAELVIKKMSS